ncbi:MAG: hypothetical protein AABW99_04775 [archaeon]
MQQPKFHKGGSVDGEPALCPRAQASIEFLLAMAALIAFLSVSLAALSGLYNAAMFSVEARNAQEFVSSLNGAINIISMLGEGSEKIVSSPIKGEWEIVSVPSPTLILSYAGSTKTFGLPSAEYTFDSIKFRGKITLRISKNRALFVDAG